MHVPFFFRSDTNRFVFNLPYTWYKHTRTDTHVPVITYHDHSYATTRIAAVLCVFHRSILSRSVYFLWFVNVSFEAKCGETRMVITCMPTILITYLVLRFPISRLAEPFGLANYVEDFKIYIFAVEIHLAAWHNCYTCIICMGSYILLWLTYAFDFKNDNKCMIW